MAYDPYNFLSALAALISTIIAAYLVIQQKIEAPNIRFVPVDLTIKKATLNEASFMLERELVFQNTGGRAGSLVTLGLVSPPQDATGHIIATMGVMTLFPRATELPTVLQPYTATLVGANISFVGKPNLKALFDGLGDKARIDVNYLVTTKKGLEGRFGYFGFKIIE
jgi:hypothetical protein